MAMRLALPGLHNVANALAAVAVGLACEVPLTDIRDGLEALEPVGGRLRVTGSPSGADVIDDCYNSNPVSARAALDALSARRAKGPRVAFLGTMKEMGEREAGGHRDVLAHAAELPIDLVVATGAFAAAAEGLDLPFDMIVEEDPAEAYEQLRDRLRSAVEEQGGATVLLKASRGVALETLLPDFEADFEPAANGVSDGGAS